MAISTEQIKKIMEQVLADKGAQPGTPAAAAIINRFVPAETPATPQGDERRFRSFGEQLLSVARASMPGSTPDSRLISSNVQRDASGLSVAVPADGGFLVQTDFVTNLLQRTYEMGDIFPRCTRIPISSNANGLVMNTLAESSRATGSRFGGIQVYWQAEGDSATPSHPKFQRFEMHLAKMVGLCYATEELLQDAVALEALLSFAFALEFNFTAEDAIIRGNGAGMPLGIINAPCLVTITAETGQVTDTIVAENIDKMWQAMPFRNRANAVWMLNQELEPQLAQLHYNFGVNSVPLYIQPGGISQLPYGTLKGRPVLMPEQMSAPGDLGDIILADMSQYIVIDKGDIQPAVSMHVRFLYDEMAYRFVWRLNGQPAWAAALTPYKGTISRSPFITLAAR